MPARTRQLFSVATFLCGSIYCTQLIANDNPETLDDIKNMLLEQQEIIELQQNQIETLQSNLSVTPERDHSSQGLKWQGYGIVNYQHYDFYENVQDDDPDKRARTDVERIVFAPSYDFGNGYSFVSEIEFEHGGTGSAVEYEQEEAGEFESEIEKGGEIVLEMAYLQYEYKPTLKFRFGEMVVPFGMVNSHHQPSQYFTLQRSLAETALIPSLWHETGIAILGEIGQIKYEAQVISALDSSGFSGPFFVKNGMQGKLEFDHADDLAIVGRFDYAIDLGLSIGAAFYIGDSTDNRPRQNLDGDALVKLYELHGRYEKGPLTIRGEYLTGTIDNSDAVTQANLNFFNGDVVGVSRTPVGHKAEAWFIEAGYDLLTLLNKASSHRLDFFTRYDVYDTHADTEGSISKIDRYSREGATTGINFKPQPGIIFKAEYSHRIHDGNIGNEQDLFGVGFGFEF